MQATRLHAIGDLRTVEVPVPSPGPGEVLVKIHASGICGTDRHLFHGEFPCKPPVTLGHEFSGTIVARGDGVVGYPDDTPVACDPNIACGHCPQCLAGRINICQNLRAIGINRDGGFAGYSTIPAHRALILPAAMPLHHGAFGEPLACCLHGVDIGAPKPGERVMVIGGGVIGLLTVQLARNAGAEVMLMTRQSAKRDLATEIGAHVTAATPQEALAHWPLGADLVLECAGTVETVEACPRLARSGGRIVVLGVLAAGAKAAIEPFDLLFREIQLMFSFVNPFTQARAIAMIASGQVRVEPLISRRIPQSDAVEAISNSPRAGEVKVLVMPG